MTGHRRRAAVLTAVGAAPLAAGALVPVSALEPGGLFCPFRAATGLPCPFCGATRAFVYAGHGDAAALDYGAVWVLFALLAVAAGLAALVIARPRMPRLPRSPAGVVALIAGVLAVPWAWALAHDATIAP